MHLQHIRQCVLVGKPSKFCIFKLQFDSDQIPDDADYTYTITNVAEINCSNLPKFWLRVRNPHGNPYGNSNEWMTLKDFLNCFKKLEICYLKPQHAYSEKNFLDELKFHGEWTTENGNKIRYI